MTTATRLTRIESELVLLRGSVTDLARAVEGIGHFLERCAPPSAPGPPDDPVVGHLDRLAVYAFTRWSYTASVSAS